MTDAWTAIVHYVDAEPPAWTRCGLRCVGESIADPAVTQTLEAVTCLPCYLREIRRRKRSAEQSDDPGGRAA